MKVLKIPKEEFRKDFRKEENHLITIFSRSYAWQQGVREEPRFRLMI